jgi:hypothetical protein
MASLLDFADAMLQLDMQIPQYASDLAVTATMAGVNNLAEVTPVDTGTAVSNWQITLNGPAAGPIDAYAPSPKGHASPIGAVRSANAPAMIDAATTALAAKRPGDEIHLQNLLEYIAILNTGTSTQAPAGFVDATELIIQDVVNKGEVTV